MEAIGLNPIRLDAIGIDPIRLNAIRLGVLGASSGFSGHPYIDPEVLASLVAVVKCDGKSNNDPDRAIIKNLVDPDNPFVVSNAAYTKGSGYADKDSPYYGALVTDGVDDSIVSSKTVQEMLGGSNEITVVSMIHLIDINHAVASGLTNYVRVGNSFIRSNSNVNDKTGIYGWTYSNSGNISTINNILGDKNDYKTVGSSLPLDSVFNVEGYSHSSGIAEICQVAWYWTFIANRVLTSDEINQVIAYYNLDKYVKPDVYYDVKKQGLSNDTPDEDWYLKDFSGNGRDMQLYNYAKKLGSGIGKYNEDFKTWYQMTNGTAIISHDKLRVNKVSDINGGNFIAWKSKSEIKAFKAKITGIPKDANISYLYSRESGARESIIINTDGEYDLPYSHQYESGVGFAINGNFPKEVYIGVTITQIPDYEGALVFDGVEDYGQFVGDLGLKDYTVAVDRAYPSLKGNGVPVVSSIKGNTSTPFLFEFADNTSVVRPYSFGATTVLSPMELSRKISYQSTYIYDGSAINKGLHDNTGNGLTIGRFGIDTQYANIALWSLLLFPYTLSEFLLERQLKRYKLGTLYPDMVEWRPIFNNNVDINKYYAINKTTNKQLSIGDYFAVTDTIELQVYLTDRERQEIASLTINGKEFTPTFIDTRYLYNIENFGEATGKKSPQKINITIDEYVYYEDIVQPYPAIVRIRDNKTNKLYTYGDKIKVGTELKYTGYIHLLPELYQVLGGIRLNGKNFNSNNIGIIEKTNIFTFTSPCKYLKTNEPNCILAPQILRIPNSSYKILGYIPDLTGKGNHGKINNSAYAGMSGANGYSEDFTTWGVYSGIVLTDSTIKTNSDFKPANSWVAYKGANTRLNSFSVNITGIPKEGILSFRVNADTYIELSNGRNDLSFDNLLISVSSGFRITKGSNLDWSNLVIEQIGEYEGSFCLDGVDDFITIPTLSHGAKQVLMKVNTQNMNGVLYDQRKSSGQPWHFAVYNTTEADSVAYNARNTNGKTYIDGVLNANITCQQLLNITHNLTITNNGANEQNTQSPVIGASRSAAANFSKFALFAFMSFPEISPEEEIKELNDIVGIEGGYVESPDYYWDAYGKSNTQADDIDDGIRNIDDSKRSIFDKSITGLAAIEQTNTDGKTGRVYDRALTTKNFAFNEESGYVDNGLVSDGVEDYLINTFIPAFTDFTVIAKRRKLSINGQFMQKGLTDINSAFILEKSFANTNSARECSFGGAKDLPYYENDITLCTKTHYNDAELIVGSKTDSQGLLIGKTNEDTLFWKGVFYKAMLYSKTIDMLSINMLKNLFEKDELIDVNNPIFKK
jgi:hypothetical protein